MNGCSGGCVGGMMVELLLLLTNDEKEADEDD